MRLPTAAPPERAAAAPGRRRKAGATNPGRHRQCPNRAPFSGGVAGTTAATPPPPRAAITFRQETYR
jgi:hypothetical protein